MSVVLNTGKTGQPITSAADRRLYAGGFGPGSYVFDIGSKCAATLVDSNTLAVQDGSLLHCGAHIDMKGITNFTIPSGVQAKRRSNICCLRYTKDEFGNEKVEPKVLTGEATDAAAPVDPQLEDGSILEDATVSDMPLYRVVTDGINARNPEPMFNVMLSMAELEARENERWDSISQRVDKLYSNGAPFTSTIRAGTNDICFEVQYGNRIAVYVNSTFFGFVI